MSSCMIVIIILFEWCYTVSEACWRCGLYHSPDTLVQYKARLPTDNVGKILERTISIFKFIKHRTLCSQGWSFISHFRIGIQNTNLLHAERCTAQFSRAVIISSYPSFYDHSMQSFRQSPYAVTNPAVHILYHYANFLYQTGPFR